ncbi:MAG: phosphatase PAP2 family protein [Beijerinckiaceae bacterium]
MTAPSSLPAALVGVCLVALIAGATFSVWPQLDLAVSHAFYDASGAFYGTSLFGRSLREILRLAAYAIFIGFALAYISGRLYERKRLVPSARNLAFLALTLALGPALLVNVAIKEHSHRPRPFQTTEFGGQWEFRPFGHFDGQCVTDCSFVSGETSTAAWTLAPALLTPPPWRAVAVGASVLFTLVMGVLRVAYGGHFPSDVTFGALINWIVVLGVAIAMRVRLPDRGPPRPH